MPLPPPPPPQWSGYAYASGTYQAGPSAGSARTGPLPLHPMSLGDMLDGAFRLYRANFRELAIAVVLLAIPQALLAIAAARPGILAGSFDATGALFDSDVAVGALLASLLASFALGPLAAGVCAVIGAKSYLGEHITWSQAIKAGARRWPILLVAQLAVKLLEAAGLLGCGVGALFVMALFVPVTPIVMVEKLGPFGSLGRSSSLVRGRYWPTLGYALLSGLIISTAASLITALPQGIAAVSPIGWIAGLASAFSVLAASLITRPLTVMFATLVYFDARIRFEGFDLQLLDRELRGN